MNGYIQLHRKLLDSAVFQNEKLLKLFMYCLLKASYKERETLIGDSIVKLEQGQFVTGRKALARDLNLSEQQVRTLISKLEKLQILHTKPTNKFTLVTLMNWDVYQNPTNTLTNNQPATNQQSTTNNKVNKDNKVMPTKADPIPYEKIAELYNEVCTNLPKVLKPSSLNDKRKRAIKKFWNHQEPENRNSPFFAEYFRLANQDQFFCGYNNNSDHSNWRADIEFLMRVETYDKFMERQECLN